MDSDPAPQTVAPTQWEFIDALGDGIYGVDRQGLCTFVNKAAIKLLGYEQAADLIGRNMHALIHHTRPDGSAYPQSECPLLHVATSGHPVRLENEMLWRRDGTPFLAEYSSFPVSNDGHVSGSVITFCDTSTRQDAATRLAVEYTVSQILAGSGDPKALPTRVLEAIGVGLSWNIGLFWRITGDEAGGCVMKCLATWHAKSQDRANGFLAASREATFGMGIELPGRTWQSQKPFHVADLTGIAGPRKGEAAQAGLSSAFAFPVMDGEAVTGAIEFYSWQHIAVDESLLETVTTLGHQIGQALGRRSVAEALAESERLKAAVLATSPDSIITVDEQAHIVDFNHTAEKAFGRTAAEVIGSDLAEMIFPPDARAAHHRAFTSTLEGRASIGRTMEMDVLRQDGTCFPAEVTMTRIAGTGRPLVTVYLRDLTASRRQQHRIRESEARFRTIADAIPQLAWMMDPDGAITWYNQRWYDFTGTRFADMAGWGWRSVHHPDHVGGVESKLRASIAAGTDWEDTFPLRSRDGTYRWFLSRAMPIREEPDETHSPGRVLGWFGTNTDVTEMREAEHALAVARDEAEAANRAKSTFMANMSHELRTPLSAIIGYSEMLREEMEDGADVTSLSPDMQKIEANARHLLGLINDVLDLSKVESGKMEAFAESFDVAVMVREVAATVDTLIRKNENHLELSLAGDLSSMHTDVTRVRQMLLNLLSNASKFTDHGAIQLRVERYQSDTGADWLAFAVTDTGIGMTPEQLSQLFRRFQQADASTTRQFGGTGLGLALTKGFAELLGGSIEVTSTVGEGSTFTVRLPASLPKPTAAAAVAADPLVEDSSGKDVFLVIDDDVAQRELIGRFLKREGYVAIEAADGASGLNLARRLQPRAVLLDVTMPGLDGWAVLSGLKGDPATAAIPVVMVTFASERALAASLGASDYVMKPINWERLRAVMERFRGDTGSVLVIDDDRDTRDWIRRSLEKNGWSVVEAANGKQALNTVARSVPRVVLLDLDMPVMNGFDFLPEFRRQPGCAAVPVVVITALDLTPQNRARLHGASQVLSKGDINLRELAETLRGLVKPGVSKADPLLRP